MKNQSLDPSLSRQQALALDTFLRHPGLHTAGLSFVGFVSVSEYALAGAFVRRLSAALPFRVEPVAEVSELNRICREGKSDEVYVVLCNAFRRAELQHSVYPALSLYRDFIFERRLKHIYVGDAGFPASAHQRLPDLFLIHQAVLQLDNLQLKVRNDLALAQVFTVENRRQEAWPERWSIAVCLGPLPFDRSGGEKRAQELASLLPEDSPYAGSLRALNLSALYLALREFEKAAPVLEAAARLAVATGSCEFAEAVALHRAFLLRGLGRWAEAAAAFRHFLGAGSFTGSPALRITAWAGLGDCWWQLNRPEGAMGCFREALGGCGKAGVPMLEAFLWGKMGEIYARRADFPAARRFYRRALAVYTSRCCRVPFAYILLSLGDTYRATDDWRFAAAYYRKALALFRQAGLAAGISAALICQARVYLEKAEAGGKAAPGRMAGCLAEAARWATNEKEPALLAEVETCLGRLARLKGEPAGAEAAFCRAIRMWQALASFGEREKREVGCLRDGGEVHAPETEAEILSCLTEARRYFERTADVPNRLSVYRALGDWHNRQDDAYGALAYYGKAVALARSYGRLSVQASVQEAIGSLYREAGKEEEARKQFAEAFRIRQLLV